MRLACTGHRTDGGHLESARERIKAIFVEGEEPAGKKVILGVLTLYLSFLDLVLDVDAAHE